MPSKAALERALFDRQRAAIDALLGEPAGDLKRYEARYLRTARRPGSGLSEVALLARVRSADAVFVGDYFTYPAAQAAFIDLVEKSRDGRPVVIALSSVPASRKESSTRGSRAAGRSRPCARGWGSPASTMRSAGATSSRCCASPVATARAARARWALRVARGLGPARLEPPRAPRPEGRSPAPVHARGPVPRRAPTPAREAEGVWNAGDLERLPEPRLALLRAPRPGRRGGAGQGRALPAQRHAESRASRASSRWPSSTPTTASTT